MPAALSVFLFECNDPRLYALSLYRSGENLPGDICAGRWAYRTKLLFTRESLASLPIDPGEAMVQLQREGYYLMHVSSNVIIFPQ